ncbi:MFS transporter [Sphingomonas oligophenolica]
MVSNIGTWMQFAAQDWLVLTELTHHDARAVGIVMALQYGPQFALLPWTGTAADHLDRRTLLMLTQGIMGLLSLVLGVLVISGTVRLWELYCLALLLGCTAAFDAPARQTFVGDLVGEDDLANAVALNSTSNNAGRMIGPALAGVCIGVFGTGWAFAANGISFGAVLVSLAGLKRDQLRNRVRQGRKRGALFDGFRYVGSRSDLRAIALMLFLFGTFGLNFPIYVSTMAVSVFHADAMHYGILSSAVAIGTLAGAFLATGQGRPRLAILTRGTALFAAASAFAALAPSYWIFAGTLGVMGFAAVTIANRSNTLMQLSSDPAMRGRVMAIRLAILLGGTPVGAPFVGWIAQDFGPRWALGVSALAGLVAMLIGLRHQRRSMPQAIPALNLDEDGDASQG